MWGAIIGTGINLAGSLFGASAQKKAEKAQRIVDEANARVQNMVGQANADASNRVRKGSNAFAVAQASLSNLTQSLGNQGKLREGGEAINALNTNLVRLQDQAVTGSLNQRITAAEQLGAVRAATVASGAGGTSAAMLHQTMQLAQARQATTHDQNMKYQTYDMLAQRAGLVSNMVMSVDQGQTFAPVDYGIDTAPLVQPPFRASTGNAQLFGEIAGLVGKGLGNLFGSGGASGRATPAPIINMNRSVVQTFPIK